MKDNRPIVLVKIGTNVLTRDNGHMDINLIVDTVDQIARLNDKYKFILVSSGAVGAGKSIVGLEDEKDPVVRKQMLASIGQGKLFSLYSHVFSEKGLIAAQVLYTRKDFKNPQSYIGIRTTLVNLIRNNIIPIINENDAVSSDESTFGDNDLLAALTASMISVEKMIILSDILGLHTSDPKIDETAKLISEVSEITPELKQSCGNSLSRGGSGGMLSKLMAAEITMSHGIPTILTQGKQDGILLKILSGQSFKGTSFLPGTKKRIRFKSTWMKNIAEVKTIVTIDSGAEKALRANKSLLSVGIQNISGETHKGDVVLVKNQDSINVAVGLITDTGNAENSAAKNGVFIHKNNLYLL